MVRPGARGRVHDRRWFADRGGDASGVPPRRVFGHPPVRHLSSFFQSLPLHEHGLEWVHPEVLAAHPLDDGSAGVMLRDLDATATGLGVDGQAYR